ncbi:ATP-dependent permease [Raphidocelis subcapitata]|uniref:ATP-dependent permease n=1 Tax=Raphidocelis subcapitata TaxID=307507 RepID=A0A2V0PC37_9CHLO|nr:ATP-dependent permease [Raphidocelis subcapitata]|eukprot:GBF94737.1 ATP-dependent permease [Raphidocelis subcapitata]
MRLLVLIALAALLAHAGGAAGAPTPRSRAAGRLARGGAPAALPRPAEAAAAGEAPSKQRRLMAAAAATAADAATAANGAAAAKAAAAPKAAPLPGLAAAPAAGAPASPAPSLNLSHERCLPGAPIAANGTCECAPGWRGRDCMVCTQPSVCPAFAGQAASTCDSHMAYGNATAYKAYDCDLVGGLAKWVSGVTAMCNVRGERLPFRDGPMGLLVKPLTTPAAPSTSKPGALLPADVGPAGSRFCKLEVGLVSQPAHPLVCVASKCTFKEGSPSFSCTNTACSCGEGAKCPPLIQSVVANLVNSTLGLTCADGDSGRCVLEGVQPRFTLQCRSGECTQPDAGARALSGATAARAAAPKAFPRIALISALPVALLLALGLLFTSYVLASRRMFASGAAADAAAAGEPGQATDPTKVTLLAPMPSIQLASGEPNPATAFVFDNIVCSVPGAGASSAAAAADAKGGGLLSRLRPRPAGSSAGAAPARASAAGEPDGFSSLGSAPAALAAADGGRKVLLHGISGVVDEGEVLGVMGPSGSGKSTLLSILSGATESVGAGARVEGAVTLGGERRRGVLRKVTAFVPQKDVLLPALTVEECVRYSALLRLPRSLTAEEIQDRIDGVLAELGLSHVATSLVGGSASIRGVSGGERRRVTIAMALVTRPRLVIMDEPTSGLDSYTAYNLMRTAQEIATHDRVVIMSLHQPSPDMFDSLSQVLLLAKGRLAYLGPPNSVAPYFGAAGLPVPRKRQPAEHMLHVASQPAGLAALLAYAGKCSNARRRITAANTPAASHGGGGGAAAAAAAAQSAGGGGGPSAALAAALNGAVMGAGVGGGGAFAALAAQSGGGGGGGGAAPVAAHANVLISVHGGASPFGLPDVSAASAVVGAGGKAASEHGSFAPSGGAAGGGGARGWVDGKARECAVLYWRAFTNMRREPRLLMLHLLVALVLGLVVGAVFFQLENTQVGVQNRLGSMFFALALFGWTSVSVVDGLVLESELVAREVAGHYYRGGTYMLASLVLDGLLLRTLPALLFGGLVYPMVGLLPEVSRVVTFMFVLATYSSTVGALTTALTALCRTSSATTLAMNIILLMWVLVGGYLVNPMSIPGWLRWIRNLSPMSFAFEVLAANEMADQMYGLRVAGFAQLDGIKGDVFLRTLGLVPSRALESAVALAVFYLGSVLLAFSATSYTLWRHGGGSFRRMLARPFRRQLLTTVGEPEP